jgi:hypothetical protein
MKQIVKRWILRISVVLMPVSIGFIIVFLTLAMLTDIHFPRYSVSSFAILCGIILWCSVPFLKNRLRFSFAAVLMSLTGLLLLFIDFGFVKMPIPDVWPFLMLFVGMAFLVSGSLEYRKAHAVYIVPALAFCVLGCLFLLFSTDIIPLSLMSFVFLWFLLLILPTVVSIIIWITRKRQDIGAPDA